MWRQYSAALRLTLVIAAVSTLLSACSAKEQGIVIVDKAKTAPPAPAPIVSAPPEQGLADELPKIPGDWYGWWHMVDTTGKWADMYGCWWDCCAEIKENGDFIIWDEESPKDAPLVVGGLKIDGRDIHAAGGSFMAQAITDKYCKVSLSEDVSGPMLCLSGSCKTDSKSSFNYDIYLRPWGSPWPESGYKPYYYEDWYLPLINTAAPMPELIGAPINEE